VSNWLGDAIYVLPEHDSLHHLAEHWHGQWAFIQHGMTAAVLAGHGRAGARHRRLVVPAPRNPPSTSSCSRRAASVTKVLQDKYGFDDFNQKVFAGGGRGSALPLERRRPRLHRRGRRQRLGARWSGWPA
jgi:NADH-quinone oxidoreductase subunit L